MKWYRTGILGLVGVTSLGVLFPKAALAAGTTLFSPIIPQSGKCLCVGSAPDWGCVLQVLQNVINTAVGLGVLLCVVYIAMSGFTLITSGGSPGAREQGRQRLTNAVVGLAVILCSWLIVDFVMKIVYEPQTAFQGDYFGPWNSIWASTSDDDSCIKVHESAHLTSGDVNILFSAPAYGESATAGGGTCTVQTSGACATSNMSAFGAAASQASQICNAESGGVAGRASGTDKLEDGTPYSWGLFQINITANPVGGLDCPSAFSKKGCTLSSCGPGTGVHVTDAALYNKCAAAAKDVGKNVAAGVSIYQKAGSSWKPWGTHTKCGLSLSHLPNLAMIKQCIIDRT